ncbi:hypothetical protein M422DRAFT_252250 [Sphaerobolus stellatus SS14]|uniref:Uncharacterized protein n=1 Tax=Sphaerobolus stellatus (strain SS14) TaxID=990650 RepID=A0A0C9UMH3_SPHS4|nr:hypothetical protein M422DRAFT_252250 [Sphaerobolus stellatus SS14]
MRVQTTLSQPKIETFEWKTCRRALQHLVPSYYKRMLFKSSLAVKNLFKSFKISVQYRTGARVRFMNARTQEPETGTIVRVGDRLTDGTLVVQIKRDNGGDVLKVPVAALHGPA